MPLPFKVLAVFGLTCADLTNTIHLPTSSSSCCKSASGILRKELLLGAFGWLVFLAAVEVV